MGSYASDSTIWLLSDHVERDKTVGFVLGRLLASGGSLQQQAAVVEGRIYPAGDAACCTHASTDGIFTALPSDKLFFNDISDYWHVCWPSQGGLTQLSSNSGVLRRSVAGSSSSTNRRGSQAQQRSSRVFTVHLIPHTHALLMEQGIHWDSINVEQYCQQLGMSELIETFAARELTGLPETLESEDQDSKPWFGFRTATDHLHIQILADLVCLPQWQRNRQLYACAHYDAAAACSRKQCSDCCSRVEAGQPCEYHAQRSNTAGGLFWRYAEARLLLHEQQQQQHPEQPTQASEYAGAGSVAIPVSEQCSPRQQEEQTSQLGQEQHGRSKKKMRGKKKHKKRTAAAAAAPQQGNDLATAFGTTRVSSSSARSSDTGEPVVPEPAEQQQETPATEPPPQQQLQPQDCPVHLLELLLHHDSPAAAAAEPLPHQQQQPMADLQHSQHLLVALPPLLQLQEQQLRERQGAATESTCVCQPAWRQLLQQLQAHVAGSDPASTADAASYVSRSMSLAVDAWEALNRAANDSPFDGTSSAECSHHSAAAADSSRDAAAADDDDASAVDLDAGSIPASIPASKKAAGLQHAAEQLFALQHCVVCLDAPRSVVLLPCRHAVLCQGCSQLMLQQARREVSGGLPHCPMCRQQVHQHINGIILS